MNFIDLIQERWPEASEQSAEALIWITPFPFVSVEKVTECLDTMKTRWGNNICNVIEGEMAEFDAEFVKYHKSEVEEAALT